MYHTSVETRGGGGLQKTERAAMGLTGFWCEMRSLPENPKGVILVVVVALDWPAHSGVLYSQLPPLGGSCSSAPPAALAAAAPPGSCVAPPILEASRGRHGISPCRRERREPTTPPPWPSRNHTTRVGHASPRSPMRSLAANHELPRPDPGAALGPSPLGGATGPASGPSSARRRRLRAWGGRPGPLRLP